MIKLRLIFGYFPRSRKPLGLIIFLWRISGVSFPPSGFTMPGMVESFIAKTGLVPPSGQDGDQYLALNISLMRLFGFWRDSDRVALVGVMLASLSTFVALHILMLDLTDIVESIEIGCSSFAMTNTVLKTLHCFYYRDEIFGIAEELKSVCSSVSKLYPEYKEVFDGREKRIRSVTFNLTVIVLLLFVDWLITPLLSYTPGEQLQLPLKLRLPFGLDSWENLLALYLVTMVMFLFLTITYTTPLLIYLSLSMMACDQFMVMSYLVKKVLDHEDGVTVRSKLNTFIQIHGRIIRVGERLKTLLSPILLLQFIFAMGAISLSAFPINMGTTNARLSKFIGFLVMQLVELYYACYFGEELVSWSGEVQSAAYNSNWCDLDEDIKKDLVVVISRAQRPCQLSIGKVQQVSLMTFTDVTKFCYTIFTLLQQLYAQQAAEQ